jgi:hypothetical protein
MRIAYCPSCGAELWISSYEAISGNIIWNPCGGRNCYFRQISYKTDPNGFVMEPSSLRGRYLYTRNREEPNR